MRNKKLILNVLVVVAFIAVAVVLLVTGHLLPVYPDTAPEGASLTARGYVYITAGGESRWFELPEEETPLTLRRTQEDGTVIENIISLLPDGAYMAHSTCENQDCVQQGTVTLENRTTRPLQNMILCLPNDVMIALYSADELADMAKGE